MRFQKSREPAALRRWRASNPGELSWKALGGEVKASIREALSREQHGVCCYCYGPVEPGSRIEHIAARTPENILEWDNLALSCYGGEGSDEHHCDKKKGSRRLKVIHPHRAPVLFATRVDLRGRLKGYPSNEALRQDVEDTLNLNARRLTNARRASIVTATVGLPSGRWSPRRLDQVLQELSGPGACARATARPMAGSRSAGLVHDGL